MMIPLPKTIRGSKVLPKQNEYLLNLINIGDWLVSRPAATLVTAKAGEARGSFVFRGVYYAVFGDKLYRDLVLTEVGTIAGSGTIRYAAGFNHAVIVTGTAVGNYTVVGSTLTQITDPDLPACSDVTFIDGRFLFTPSNGDPVIYSDVGDGGSIGALSYFDAESLPDGNKLVENIKNDIFVGGEASFERFRNSGPTTNPFVRVPNAMVSVGYVGGKIATKDSMIFLGKDKDAGYAFYLFAEGTAQIISTDTINELLNLPGNYTPTQLAAVKSQRFNWRGADCYAFELPDRTLLFQGGKWSYVDSGITGLLLLSTWGFYSATLFDGIWYVQGHAGLYKLAVASEDSTGKFSRQIVTFARSAEEDVMSVSEMRLGVTNGVGAGTIGLSLSKNGKLWSPPFYRSMGAVGEHDQELIWNGAGGLGMFDGYMGLAFYTTAAVEIAIDSLVAK